jgi:hypothetical protein
MVMVITEPLLKASRVGFQLDPASRMDRIAARAAYSPWFEDAFHQDNEAGVAGGRRRATAYSTDKGRSQRAEQILGLGPDAVLMDFPEGYVPRQGQ